MSPRGMSCYPCVRNEPAKDGVGHERPEARRSVNSPHLEELRSTAARSIMPATSEPIADASVLLALDDTGVAFDRASTTIGATIRDEASITSWSMSAQKWPFNSDRQPSGPGGCSVHVPDVSREQPGTGGLSRIDL